MPVIASPPKPDWLPDWIGQLLDSASLNPANEISAPTIDALGKPVSELLGAVLTTPKKTGLPSKLRITNWNAPSQEVVMHGVRKAGEELRATPSQIDELIRAGNVDLQQPPMSAVEKIRRLLSSALGQ